MLAIYEILSTQYVEKCRVAKIVQYSIGKDGSIIAEYGTRWYTHVLTHI